MFKAKITNDNDKISEYKFDDYTLSIDGDSLILELINNDIPSFRYQIMSDVRQPDLGSIQDFITSQLKQAVSENQPFVLSEYLVRAYIYIGSDDERRQFTAHKL